MDLNYVVSQNIDNQYILYNLFFFFFFFCRSIEAALSWRTEKTTQMAGRRWIYLIKSSSMTLMTLTFKVGRQTILLKKMSGTRNKDQRHDTAELQETQVSVCVSWRRIVASIKGEKPRCA